MKKNKVFLYIDMDSFFASCETSINKEFKNKPLVIANGNVISSLSYEAKKLNIKVAMPLFQAKNIYPNIIVRKGNISLYREISNKIWEYIKQNFTKNIEIISIDEAVLEISELLNDYLNAEKLASIIQKSIKYKFDLTCSIGISFNRLYAKLGSELRKPNGILSIDEKYITDNIDNMSLSKICGIGTKTFSKLNKYNIDTVMDLKNSDDNFLLENFNINIIKIKNKLLNKSDDILKIEKEIKSYSNEITLTDEYDFSIKNIKQYIKNLTEELYIKIKKNDLKIKNVKLIIKYNSYLNKKQTFSYSFEKYTSNYNLILSGIYYLLDEKYIEQKVRLIGISFSKLLKKTVKHKQIDIYNINKIIKENETRENIIMNNINSLFNKQVIKKIK